MNRLTASIGSIVLVSATFALAGCGNGGSKFVGTWDCGSGTTLKISHMSGNKYSAEAEGIGIPGGASDVMHYKDGTLGEPGGAKWTIDKTTGELVYKETSGGFACTKSKG